MEPDPPRLRPSPGLSWLLGLWLGGTLLLMVSVAYSFRGIEVSLLANEKLAQRANLDPEDPEARRSSILHVYAGELNRLLFRDWNRAQLLLAAVALLVANARFPRRGVILSLILAALAVLVLTFYLAPEVTRAGRELDFVPRATLPERFEQFDRLHRAYILVEIAKTSLLALATLLSARAPSRRPPS